MDVDLRMVLLQAIYVGSLAARASNTAAPSARSCSEILLVKMAVMFRDDSRVFLRDVCRECRRHTFVYTSSNLYY